MACCERGEVVFQYHLLGLSIYPHAGRVGDRPSREPGRGPALRLLGGSSTVRSLEASHFHSHSPVLFVSIALSSPAPDRTPEMFATAARWTAPIELTEPPEQAPSSTSSGSTARSPSLTSRT